MPQTLCAAGMLDHRRGRQVRSAVGGFFARLSQDQ
jgi:hypothetical protein